MPDNASGLTGSQTASLEYPHLLAARRRTSAHSGHMQHTRPTSTTTLSMQLRFIRPRRSGQRIAIILAIGFRRNRTAFCTCMFQQILFKFFRLLLHHRGSCRRVDKGEMRTTTDPSTSVIIANSMPRPLGARHSSAADFPYSARTIHTWLITRIRKECLCKARSILTGFGPVRARFAMLHFMLGLPVQTLT